MSRQNTARNRAYKAVTIVALAWALIGTMAAATYYTSYEASRNENQELRERVVKLQGNLTGAERSYAELLAKVTVVDLYIDYGNGTVSAYKGLVMSSLRPTALLAIMSVADVEFTFYPGLGVAVTGVNGVKQSTAEGKYWLYYFYDQEEMAWKVPMYAAGEYRLGSGMSISWNLTKSPF
ncbi:MAG: DUF4430 domain-containing protein [Candidatus Bathyarchaeia archaeon]